MSGDNTTQWLVVRLDEQSYALQADSIQEMVQIAEVRQLPLGVEFLRGLITIRDKAMPLFDLRTRLGLSSLDESIEKLIELFDAREQDHINWLIELEQSVKERRPFKLTTDPHKCAFGRWYDNFKSENLIVQAQLGKFDQPHKSIHAIAEQVAEMEERGEFDEALALIETTRNQELALMITLFEQTRRVIRETRRELAVLVYFNSSIIALAVDGVHSVEQLKASDGGELSFTVNDMVQGFGKSNMEDMVMLLDHTRLLSRDQMQSLEVLP
ncbi:MAG: chemotaxis protein CheW [Deltaproteobacteria bacterium]|nr:chemotaxis protein CheW [Deltaproteobacteria bacterium]